MELKILILSEDFYAGDAITTLNLFSKWKKSSMFVASRNESMFFNNFKSGYRLGYDEIKFRFPLNLFIKPPESEVINCDEKRPLAKRQAGRWAKFVYLGIIIPIMKWLGIASMRLTYHVSDHFLKWVDDMSPNCVYSSIGSLNMAKFVKELMEARPDLKLIIHGYDDWIESAYFSIYSAHRVKSDMLYNLMSSATLTFAVSERMAFDYQKRYKRKFYVFSNPVNSNLLKIKKDSNSQRITFIGKISYHNIESIIFLASSLNKINIPFHIYSSIHEKYKKRILSAYKNTYIHDWVDHNMIPQILSNSGILYLPVSMDKQSIKFTKYSMSTKMSEYLSSGTPVLYHGPDGIAMTDFVEKYKCAFIIKNNNIDELVSLINKILNDKELSSAIVRNADEVFKMMFEIEKTSADFMKIVNETCKKCEI